MTEEDMGLKILHTADWHLGHDFSSFGDAGLALSRARLEAVDRLLGLAEQYDVDAVLAAGDLFEEAQPAATWWEGLAARFEALGWEDRVIVLLPGNHDPLHDASVWHPRHPFRKALPSFVHVVDHDAFELPIGRRPGDEGVVYGVPCRSRAGQTDPTQSLPAREVGDERVRIGLVHGQTLDVAGYELNFPVSVDAIERCGLDYLAVGDTHGFKRLPDRDRGRVVYPGTPEQTRFDEREAGGVVLARFRRATREVKLHWERVGRWTWREELVRDLASLHRLAGEDELESAVLRLQLELRLPMAAAEEHRRLVVQLRGSDASHGRVGVLLLTDGTRYDTADAAESAAELPDVLREVVRRLRERSLAGGEDALVAEKALLHLFETVREAG